MLDFTPKKFAFKNKIVPPNQNITKTKIIIWLFSSELIAKVQANNKFKIRGPPRSHCFIWYCFFSGETHGITTNFNFV